MRATRATSSDLAVWSRRLRPAVAALAICLGLAACGGSSRGTSSEGTATGGHHGERTSGTYSGRVAARRHEVELIRSFAQCMRQRGIDLPEPDASGRIDTRGIDERSRRYKATVATCFGVVKGRLKAGG